MRTPVFLIRLVGLLLCAVSVLLALETPIAAPGQTVGVLLSLLVPHLPLKVLAGFNLLTPVVIGGLFWYCTSFLKQGRQCGVRLRP